MSFGTIFYTLLFQPLQILFEVIYISANMMIKNRGLSIIALSLAMNFLVLPLYRRADAMQEQERDIEAKLEKGVAHIKKTFKGDERMMMLQTYYRQNNYKPTYVLRGVTSLFLQILFFIAAYKFLSNLEMLNGTSFGLIKDLSAPDGLLTLFGISINVLPIIMTVINIISSAVYSKEFPLKTKIQLYATALFFLVFLYKSPSGLVFYWTLNNAFSLLKTVVLRSKNPSKLTKSLLAVGGFAIFLYAAFNEKVTGTSGAYLLCIGAILLAPIIIEIVKRKDKSEKKPLLTNVNYNTKLFIAGCIFMAILTGAVIPSAVISSSPQEFIFTSYYKSPIWYIVSSLCLSLGSFVIWLGVFYWLASPKIRVIYEKAVWVMCCLSIVNYMLFAKNLGTLTSSLLYKSTEDTMLLSSTEIVINAIVVAFVCGVVLFAHKKWSKQVLSLVIVCTIALSGMSVVNVAKINNSISKVDFSEKAQDVLNIELSKTGKNVIVIMIDRAFGPYIPYFFNEKPELVKKYDGFTYYHNTISFGGHTNFGSPAFFGGYEYTPTEMNTRNSERLVDKHNESLKVMPSIFLSNGYDVTVSNSNYANYQWIPDLSVFDDLDGIKAYNTGDSFLDESTKKDVIQNNRRNFFIYSLMKTAPMFLQSYIYHTGSYFNVNSVQAYTGVYCSTGVSSEFMNAYNVLTELSSMTSISDNKIGNVLLLTNDTTHEQQMLQEPSYTPEKQMDNREYYKNLDRFTLNGKTLKMEDLNQITTYECNMAAIIQIGNWLDYLREIGVYDNTKIIIASDHGYTLNHLDELIKNDENVVTNDMSYYTPLLMVKDYNATGFKTSEEFMTNADIPTIAFKDTVKNPVNPYTNKPINNLEKYAHKQYVISSDDWSVSDNNGKQFLPADWYTIHDSMWNKDNWELVARDKILTNNDVK